MKQDADDLALPSFGEALRVWTRIGLLSFGGPAGQIALMHRELVERRRWIGEQRFLHALNYCMLLPGPEAQQLAIYIGWLMHRTRGGLAAGLLFILPGACVMLALSLVYARFHASPFAGQLFFGVKAAVLAVVVEAVLRIGRRALKTRLHLAIAALAFIAIYGLHLPFPLIIVLAGLIGWIAGRIAPTFVGGTGHAAGTAADTGGIVDRLFERGELGHADPSARRALRALATWLPLWLAPLVLLAIFAGPQSVWTSLAGFFTLMAVVTFGGAYAVLAYVAQAAVGHYGWLVPGEMIDGLGLAETTPGPLILVLQFVGFLAAFRQPGALDPWLAGCLGALLTLWVTFAPCFLWIFLGAPYIERLRGNRQIGAALSMITAAVVGVILNLAVWFAVHVMFGRVAPVDILGLGPELPVLASFDWRAGLLCAAAMLAMLRLKVGMAPVLAVSAAVGVMMGYFGI